MIGYEYLERELQDALNRLYDPDHEPSESLCALIGCDPTGGPLGLHAALVGKIESLRPDEDIPSTAMTWRVYRLLHCRYVLRLTQEETADRLHLSRRSLQRAQAEAVHALARIILGHEQSLGPSSDATDSQRITTRQSTRIEAPVTDWKSQVHSELESLKARAPQTQSDLAQVIGDVIEIETSLAARRGVSVQLGSVQPNLTVDVHPAVLRQMLISVIEELARHSATGPITLFAWLENGNVKITIGSPIEAEQAPSKQEIIESVLVYESVSVDADLGANQVFVEIEIPSSNKITVLVVDDNSDLVHFYRRALDGTAYHIVHVAEGRDLVDIIRLHEPAVIVLDVMLPDSDGWKLLAQIHDDPATRATPVIVCSVVRAEELALSLGAKMYLAKPVRPADFRCALDRVLSSS